MDDHELAHGLIRLIREFHVQARLDREIDAKSLDAFYNWLIGQHGSPK